VTPRETVTNLRHAFEAFTKGDFDTVSEFIDPSLEVDDRILIEPNPTERGIDALIANAAMVKEAFGDVSWKPEEIVELGDQILVRVHVEGSGRSTKLPMDDDIGQLYTIRDGRAVKVEIFRTWAEAREAAGLKD
jgi:ketosteroid isomerase-like protein